MAKAIILRGVSGAGKSTVAELFRLPIVSADYFFIDLDGNYNFDRSLLHLAHESCFGLFKGYLKMDYDVVVDNTNTSEKEIKRYIEYATKHGHEVISLVVENRHGNDSIHDVPQDTRLAQARRLQNSIKLI